MVEMMSPSVHLSGVLFLLDDTNTESQGCYNFYTNANLSEVKRFAQLVESIRLRFSHLQKSWPEHATLQDVIICCSEILHFKHHVARLARGAKVDRLNLTPDHQMRYLTRVGFRWKQRADQFAIA